MFTSKDYTPPKRKVGFIRIAGRLVRDVRGREVTLSSATRSSSMERFKTGYPIGFHKWY